MVLGDILKELTDESQAAGALVALGDVVLIAEVEALRLEHQETVAEYVAGATRRFACQASDQDWLSLSTALERSDAPAATCLRTFVAWAVMRDQAAATEGHTCSCP
jgi:hypothetical protein